MFAILRAVIISFFQILFYLGLYYSMAAICFIGGIIGYTRRNSKISLYAGTLIGILYAYSGYLVSKNLIFGHQLSLATSLVLTLGMGARGVNSGKVMPIVMSILGLVNCVYHYRKIMDFVE